MGWIIGNGNPNWSFTLSPGAAIRHWWNYGGPWHIAQHGFVLPASIRTHANRIVGYNQAVEQHSFPGWQGIRFTLDVRCEEVTGTGAFGVYRIRAVDLV